MTDLQEFIYHRIRISAAPYLPIAILLFLVSAGIIYFLLSFDKPITVPRLFIAVPIMLPIIAIWLIYQWAKTLNIQKHPLVKLLFEEPAELKKVVISKNELGVHRVTFERKEGWSSFLTFWNKDKITVLVDLLNQNLSENLVIEWDD